MASLTMKFWIGLLCHCMGILFCCISMATVTWCSGIQSSAFISIGLWKACLNADCIYMNEYNNMVANVLGRGWLTVCQICSATGVAILCATGLLAVTFLTSMRCRQYIRTLQVLTGLIVAGAVCYAYTLMLFVVETHNSLVRGENNLHYGSSFYLGIGGVITCGLAAILYLLEYNRMNEPRIKYVVLK